MTREEAIRFIEQSDLFWNRATEEEREALDVAIEALSTDMSSDLISRADAIEAVAQQWLFEASAESPYVNDDDIGEYRKLAEELFEDVPSADTVSREDTVTLNSPISIQAEMVAVVRCKECKHWDTADGDCYGHDYYYCSEENDYCSHGERKVP